MALLGEHLVARRGLVGVVLAGVAVVDVLALRPYARQASRSLSHPDVRWLALAVLVELASMSAFARLQRRMLAIGGTRVPLRRMLALTYAANAVSMTLPAGAAVSTGYTFRRFRGWGASAPLAGFSLVASGVLSTMAFGLLGIVGALLAGVQHTSPTLIVTGAAGSVAAALALRWLARHPAAVLARAEAGLRLANRLLRRDPDAGRRRLSELVAELLLIRPRNSDWAAGLGFAALNWLGDLVCLIACCRAVGAPDVTIALAIAAYLAGMGVACISLVPGGIGVIALGMILTLGHSGLSVGEATAAVLLYRLVSLVFVVVIGWLSAAFGWDGQRRASTPATSVSTAPSGASTRTCASGSPRVAPWFTMATCTPRLAARRTNRKPDATVSEEPSTISERLCSTRS